MKGMKVQMRGNVHKLLGLGLSLCLILGGSLGPASTGYAADTSGEEIATVEASEQSQDIQEDTVQSETQNEDAEPDVQESDASGQEQQTQQDASGEQEITQPAEGTTESESTEPEKADTAETADTEVPETQETEPEELKENSFRYQNGEPVHQPQVYSRAASYPYAWEKVNGKYMNSIGQVIEGATKKGIDVSHHQGTIDWQKVKNDGIDFAIIRCGYGGNYTSYDDRQWLRNVSECERLGIPYGVYLYSYSENTEDAKSEAAHVLRLLEGHNPAYGVYYDLEDENTTGTVSNTTIGTIAKTFCDQVSASGYKVGIYASKYWWQYKLTSSVFKNEKWSKWVAQYNTSCTYEGTYDMWQCTSEGSVSGINGFVDLNFWMSDSEPDENAVSVSDRNIISGSAHMQDYGWLNSVKNGVQIGVTGESRRLEAFKLSIGSGYGDLGVRYTSFVEDKGWQTYAAGGQVSGTTGQNRAVQAVKIELTGTQAKNYDIYYRAHVQDYGWLGWAKNGAAAGTTGYEKRMEALQIAVVPKGSAAPGSTSNVYKEKAVTGGVGYETHMQTYGWRAMTLNGATGGVVGESKRMEAFKVDLLYPQYSGDVEYRSYVQNKGWLGWVKNGTMSGTSGQGLRMEAVQIRLTGEMAKKYDIYYRVHTQDFGWLGWAKNGAGAGSSGYSRRIEGIQIKLVAKGAAAPGSTSGAFKDRTTIQNVVYQAHMQDYGWYTTAFNGSTGGVTGAAKRMEALKISLENTAYTGGIQYRAHVQNIGWQSWKSNGAVSGTEGKKLRMEAVQIQLTGEMAKKYDIYYRVHVQDYGWLGWTKNGAKAGTEGLNRRMEGIQIQLVEKGKTGPTGGGTAFRTK